MGLDYIITSISLVILGLNSPKQSRVGCSTLTLYRWFCWRICLGKSQIRVILGYIGHSLALFSKQGNALV